MAILDNLPGMEVTIQSLNTDLPEYVDEAWSNTRWAHVPATKRVSKYVECQPDSEFSILMMLKMPFRIDTENLTFKVYVDGNAIANCTCEADYYKRHNHHYWNQLSNNIERLSPTQVSRRQLKFSSIRKVDDPDMKRVKDDAKSVQGLGEIVVAVFRTRDDYDRDLGRDYSQDLAAGTPTEVAEKALKGKAISTGVAFGQQTTRYQVARYTIDIDGEQNPLAVFVFKYRTRADLQSEMIIPRSPTPERARPRVNETPRDRTARLANLKREIAQIKAEEGVDGPSHNRKRSHPGDGDGEDGDEIEIVSRTYKTSRRPGGGLVVDLTDDD